VVPGNTNNTVNPLEIATPPENANSQLWELWGRKYGSVIFLKCYLRLQWKRRITPLFGEVTRSD
jgi:hypothetical protein